MLGKDVVILGKYTISCLGIPELGLKSAIVRIGVWKRANTEVVAAGRGLRFQRVRATVLVNISGVKLQLYSWQGLMQHISKEE